MQDKIQVGTIAFRDKFGRFIHSRPLYKPSTEELQKAWVDFETLIAKTFTPEIIRLLETKSKIKEVCDD